MVSRGGIKIQDGIEQLGKMDDLKEKMQYNNDIFDHL